MVMAAGKDTPGVDVDAFAVGYTDEAAHQAESELRAEFCRRDVFVERGQRSPTWRFDVQARQFLRESAEAFFACNEDLLTWWRSRYAGSQLWLMSNGLADTRPLKEELSSNREFFSSPVVVHHYEPGMAEAYRAARTEFIRRASAVRGFTLYVNDSDRIDVRR